ncbi:MAG: pimeloyl-ACP methyl ester carboxylesterase [Kiritimatiellia bacterium]|jgi:pimeloyl-ACP methyl ester carboxylesterase
MTNIAPWLDREEYPFSHNFLDTPEGRLHYVDEGVGEVILFVHGTPTWSYLWRRAVRELRDTHRCVAPDHLGFGLSDKPSDFGYTVEQLAEHLQQLVEHLDLRDVTLVVHDFGGPIGTTWALAHSDRVRRIVALNTWLWDLSDDRAATNVSRLTRGWLGTALYKSLNLAARFLLPKVAARPMASDVHKAYLNVVPRGRDRVGQLAFARNLGTSVKRDHWRRFQNELGDRVVGLIWGLKDPTAGADALRRMRDALPNARVRELDDVGHFPQEEAPEVVVEELRLALTRGSHGGQDVIC